MNRKLRMGMAFIETAVASAHSDQKWTSLIQPNP